jgi:hypothetical protein
LPEPLRYSRLAAKEIKQVNFKENEIWRLRWVTVLTLLIAVGHVFRKMDNANCDSITLEKIENFWKKKKEDVIFKNFIDSARNIVLKEFNFDHVVPQSCCMITESGIPMVTEEYVFFKNDRTRTVYDLIDEALGWWDAVLDEFKVGNIM